MYKHHAIVTDLLLLLLASVDDSHCSTSISREMITVSERMEHQNCVSRSIFRIGHCSCVGRAQRILAEIKTRIEDSLNHQQPRQDLALAILNVHATSRHQ